ncbi:putative 2-hydroxyacid dehydrogenase [Dactylonectria macrodidyma]|uniref:2-hydroxyacid dehydrogenase n=1 Tax=Dactylonectria macrodidyma TaxID=307937 RepID=A0A9P9DYC7_9HYPO|nr:putative 2-hydroxyacid dehydrogenase [Dactylonectria macrodidyma]
MGPASQPCTLSKDKLLLFFPKEPDSAWISRVKANYPGLEVIWASSLKEDGQLLDFDKLPAEYWKGITMLFVDWAPPPARLISGVKFIQLASAGADLWHDHPAYLDKNVIFSNASGVYTPQIAEWVMGTWLMSQRQFLRYQKQMDDQFWEPSTIPIVEDSYGLRMGILGYGSIGRQCARLAGAMGMEVYAYTHSERSTPESRRDDHYHQFCVPGTGDPEGVIPSKWFHGTSEESINAFLAQDLDILVISLPLTKDTEGFISHKQFEILSKKKTFLTNIARGRHVDTQALITALERGQIRGAALDVTDPEPLPKEHPLWKAPNVYITPHVSWFTKKVWDRSLGVLESNLARLNDNKPCINILGNRH